MSTRIDKVRDQSLLERAAVPPTGPPQISRREQQKAATPPESEVPPEVPQQATELFLAVQSIHKHMSEIANAAAKQREGIGMLIISAGFFTFAALIGASELSWIFSLPLLLIALLCGAIGAVNCNRWGNDRWGD